MVEKTQDLPPDIAELFAAAEKLPLGKERDSLLWKALELEARLNVERWVGAPGLRSPRGTAGKD
ncbi:MULTISPECIES: hypothetical protein [unclassified Bradyrhizobium]|uniref:hypothetical protein n=1 Tax=unclassified Bradyrhizobium TaxID=2631580 RepID=UPI00054EBC1B|nr:MULTISPECIES: hypothetical protein [unclassified Bradyrhizobium]MCP3465410.1 hypothetical protein [Bradyrhizobium sp. CCGUVB23]